MILWKNYLKYLFLVEQKEEKLSNIDMICVLFDEDIDIVKKKPIADINQKFQKYFYGKEELYNDHKLPIYYSNIELGNWADIEQFETQAIEEGYEHFAKELAVAFLSGTEYTSESVQELSDKLLNMDFRKVHPLLIAHNKKKESLGKDSLQSIKLGLILIQVMQMQQQIFLKIKRLELGKDGVGIQLRLIWLKGFLILTKFLKNLLVKFLHMLVTLFNYKKHKEQITKQGIKKLKI
jgi:hypothetical protein